MRNIPWDATMELFDPTQEVDIVCRRLPHWSQAGAVAFLTWRTWDSMPEKVIRRWQGERDAWLGKQDINPSVPDWQAHVARLDPARVKEMQQLLSDRWNDHLDECHGSCVLRRPEFSQIITDSLHHFNGDRYQLDEFVVMPNHVHVLAAFPHSKVMLQQCESWKRFTATRINRLLGVKGRFWQQDAFDHLVRSQERFEYLRDYIANNPIKANLRNGEYCLYSSRRA
jgi:REP element-mobilizing transposase RayT